MFAYIFVKYLHYLGIFTMVASIVAELVLVKKELTRKEIKRLYQIDNIYGIGSILAVGMGFLLWFVVGKSAQYYSMNGIFHIKVTLAIIVGILSIIPTIYFRKNRKGIDDDEVLTTPSNIRGIIIVELIIMFLIPLLATTMANGITF